MIRPETARQLGYQWAGGKSSPLYAFASSGLVRDVKKLNAEIVESHMYARQAGQPRRERELAQLAEFVGAKLERQSDGSHAAPWAYHNGPAAGNGGAFHIYTPNGSIRERHRTLRGVLDYANRRGAERAEAWRLTPARDDVRVRLTFGDGFYTLWTMPNSSAAREFLARRWPGLTVKEVGK